MEGLFLTIIEKYGSPAAWFAIVFIAIRISTKVTRVVEKLEYIDTKQAQLIVDTDKKHNDHYTAIGSVREDVAKIKGHIGINGIH